MILRKGLLILLVLLTFGIAEARHDPGESTEDPFATNKSAKKIRAENAECMKDTKENQRLASQYIVGLKAKAANLSRPELKHNLNCGSEIAYNEVATVLDRAERLSQLGATEKIEEPEFRFNGNEVDGEY